MKGFVTLLALFFSAFGLLNAQTVQIKYEQRNVKFPAPSYSVFVPASKPSASVFKMMLDYADDNKSIVFKTPVCYTAFFCKMEVETQKAMGIMIKVHAGDYDSYMDQKIPR